MMCVCVHVHAHVCACIYLLCMCVFAETDCTNSKHDFQELYRGMKSLQNSQKFTLDIDVQHPSLKPRLRPYQQDAVRWMLKQERFGEEDRTNLTGGLYIWKQHKTCQLGQT